MSALTHYAPVLLGAVLINAADIYFLQSDRLPPLHRSPSFWLYLVLQCMFALFAAWVLYAKVGMDYTDWPLVAVIAVLGGFGVVQSFTLKLGDVGVVDARQLFDSWKQRVIEDTAKTNASRKRGRQTKVATALARTRTVVDLEGTIRFLAPSVGADANEVIARSFAAGVNSALEMSIWIASTDLEYAETLLVQTQAEHRAPPTDG